MAQNFSELANFLWSVVDQLLKYERVLGSRQGMLASMVFKLFAQGHGASGEAPAAALA